MEINLIFSQVFFFTYGQVLFRIGIPLRLNKSPFIIQHNLFIYKRRLCVCCNIQKGGRFMLLTPGILREINIHTHTHIASFSIEKLWIYIQCIKDKNQETVIPFYFQLYFIIHIGRYPYKVNLSSVYIHAQVKQQNI